MMSDVLISTHLRMVFPACSNMIDSSVDWRV